MIIDSIPTLAWCATADGLADFFNRRWLDYTGLTPDEAYGWKWSVALHPDDAPHVVEVWRALLQAGEPGETEARLRGADGQYRWFLFRCVPLRDEQGRVVKWSGTNTDIEHHKRIESDLRQSKVLLDETQRVTRSGSIGLNVATGDVFWSDEGARIFGFEPHVHPTTDLIGQRVHPDDRWLASRLVDCAVRDSGAADFEFRLVMPDESIKHIRALSPARCDAENGIVLWAVIDITAGKEAEAALQEMQAELARITRVTVLGELTASIAHEVLQPIAAISTTGEACLRWLTRPEPVLAEVHDGLERMVADAQRAGEVVRRIRTMTGKIEPEQTGFDLNQTVEDVLVLIRSELVRQRVVLETDLDPDLPQVRGDRVQVQQVLINLVMNGVQAMTEVEPRDRDPRDRVLTLRSRRPTPDAVLVEVEDAGRGVDPDIADRLFEPFFTTRDAGMGMGLSICRSIIGSHGGRLWFSPGKVGTIFHFTLPAN